MEPSASRTQITVGCTAGIVHGRGYTSSLARKHRTLRLLKLWAGPCDAKTLGPKSGVEGRLETYRLDVAPPFIALSYSWGEQTKLVELKIGHNAKLLISQHLEDGLRQLRQLDMEVLVWVDAVCINQDDEDERSAQVRFMRNIYAAAEWVFIWIGKASTPLPFVQAVDPKIHADILWQSATHRKFNYDCFVGINVEKLHELLGWKERAWWRRKWVLQEITVARREPYVLYDDFTILGLSFFSGWHQCWGVQGASLDNRPSSSFGIEQEAAIAPWKLRNLWSTKSLEALDLGTVLQYAKASLVTNPSDHVYAVLGLTSSAQQSSAVDVDYRKNPEQVFEDVSFFLWNTTPDRRSLLNSHELSSTSKTNTSLRKDLLVTQWCRSYLHRPTWVCNFAKVHSWDMTDFQDCWRYSNVLSEHQPVTQPERVDGETGAWTSILSPAGTVISQRPVVEGSFFEQWKNHRVNLPWLDTQVSGLLSNKGVVLQYALFLGQIGTLTSAGVFEFDFPKSTSMAEVLGCTRSAIDQIRLSRLPHVDIPGTPLDRYMMFTTVTGHVGMCYCSIPLTRDRPNDVRGDVEPGDEIVQVYGATMCFVLRHKVAITHQRCYSWSRVACFRMMRAVVEMAESMMVPIMRKCFFASV